MIFSKMDFLCFPKCCVLSIILRRRPAVATTLVPYPWTSLPQLPLPMVWQPSEELCKTTCQQGQGQKAWKLKLPPPHQSPHLTSGWASPTPPLGSGLPSPACPPWPVLLARSE